MTNESIVMTKIEVEACRVIVINLCKIKDPTQNVSTSRSSIGSLITSFTWHSIDWATHLKIWGLLEKKMYIEFFAKNHMVVTPWGEKSDFWNILPGELKDSAPQS